MRQHNYDNCLYIYIHILYMEENKKNIDYINGAIQYLHK